MGNPVTHFEITGKDAKKLHQFYGEIFGWKIDANNPMNYGMVDTQSDGKGIGGGIAPAQGPNMVTFYVEVNDPQAYLDRIETAGGKTVVPVTAIPDSVTFAVFSDPEGNALCLVKGDQ